MLTLFLYLLIPLVIILNLGRKISSRSIRYLCNLYHHGYCRMKRVNLEGKGINFNGYAILNFSNKASIKIGKYFLCNSGVYCAIDNLKYSKIIVHKNAILNIGDYSGISNTVIQCYDNISIGNYVNIGAGTIIFDSNFHSTNWQDREDRTLDISRAKTAPIIIKDYVFIGARSIICKGVTIGSKSMICTGSVVVCDIPDCEIWGGNPARFIKKITE